MLGQTKSMQRILAGALTATALIGATVAYAADEPANVIAYRGSVMKALSGHIGAIASVVKGETGYSAHVAAHAQGLHATGLMLSDIFPEGSGEGETRALPAIWQDRAKFDGVVKDFNAATATLAEAAAGGDMAAIGAALQEVGKGCGSCHKPFRKEKQ